LSVALASRFISDCLHCHIIHAPDIVRCFHRKHTLAPRVRIRFPSVTRAPHVLHATYKVFCVHRSAIFFTTRLRLTSSRHLPHANA
jgi:hypothetical protein